MENILLEYPYNKNIHIALVSLNRPKVLNALSTDLMQELVDCFLALDKNPDVRVIILTGNDRAFAAGADIAQMVAATPVDQINDQRFRTWEMLKLITKPVIAAVNGFALGGGCELALACDFRVSADNAKLGQPEILLGLIPGAGGTQRLPRLIGPAKAKDLIFTGRFVDAQEALEIGLVDVVVPNEQVLDRALEWAQQLAKGPRIAMQAAKRAIDLGLDVDLNTGIEIERQAFAGLFATQDARIGMQSFVENGAGKATFTGQ